MDVRKWMPATKFQKLANICIKDYIPIDGAVNASTLLIGRVFGVKVGCIRCDTHQFNVNMQNILFAENNFNQKSFSLLICGSNFRFVPRNSFSFEPQHQCLYATHSYSIQIHQIFCEKLTVEIGARHTIEESNMLTAVDIA